MNVCDHKSTSLSSAFNKPSSVPKGTAENGQIYQESNDPIKTTTMKHFMSQTISATSKINPSRKKILAERNDSLDNPLQKSQSLDPKSIQKVTGMDSKSISSTEFGNSEQDDVGDDLPSSPHDPLTNYPSPRPKFLRYNPNRRHEILLRREIEGKQGKDGCLEHKKGVAASSFGFLPQEGEEIDESDDQFEKVDHEERGWELREVLKVLILLVVLVVSTSYISFMNSPTPFPAVQAVVTLKDGYHMLQEHVIGFVKNIEHGSCLLFDVDGEVVEENMIGSVEIEEAENSNRVLGDIQSGESKVIGMIEEEEGEVDKYIEETESENEEIEDEVDEYIEREESENVDIEVEENEKEADKCIVGLKSGNREILDQEENGLGGNWDEIIELLKREEVVSEAMKGETFKREMGGIGNSTDGYSKDNGAESNMKEWFIKHMGTESILKAVIGISLVSSIIASMVLGVHFRKNRNERKKNSHPPDVRPCFESMMAEKCSSLISEEEEKHMKSPASSAISKSLINSIQEDSKEMQKSCLMSVSHEEHRAPTVELLGELEVGEEMSSSLRSCGITESEVSSYSVSMEMEVFGKKPNSNSIHVQPATFSEISTVNSSSSYEKKTVEKEVTTPLRRSSRIRNRAALSPRSIC